MDKSVVESRAINKLEDVLTRTEQIETNIAKGDKIPSWDGELIVYNSKKINKSNIMGNIRIQVKGHFQDDIDKKTIKHPVSKDDLKNFQTDGGCMFFVVIMKNMDDFSIYYNSLLPYDLKLLLDDFPENQSSMSVEFSQYPKNDLQLQMKILRSFIYNRTKQIGTVQAAVSLREIQEDRLKDLDNLSFTLFQTGGHIRDMFQSAFRIPTYIYANTFNGKVSVPVEKVKFEEMTTGEIPLDVCLNGNCYYKNIRIKKSIDDEQLLIGQSFVCSTQYNKLNFDLKGNLSERITDLNFLLELYENKKSTLTIGNSYSAEFDLEDMRENYEEYKNHLMYLGILQLALNKIGVKVDLECDLLTEQDERTIQIIIKCVCGGSLLICDKELPQIINLKAANITVPVMVDRKSSNKYKLKSLFEEINACVKLDNGELISAYLLMKKKSFLLISNMNYELITKEILQQEYTQELEPHVINFILNGISAYDECRNYELYEMLLKVSKWQISNHETDINTLNYLQILKRNNEISLQEIEKLNDIKTKNQELQIKLGAAILLESKMEIKMYWKQMEGEQQALFKKYPIYYLAKDYLS